MFKRWINLDAVLRHSTFRVCTEARNNIGSARRGKRTWPWNVFSKSMKAPKCFMTTFVAVPAVSAAASDMFAVVPSNAEEKEEESAAGLGPEDSGHSQMEDF